MSKAIRIEENVPLAPLTTLQIGGPARFFVRAASEEQVVEAFDIVASRGMDVFVLGGGSNLLIADGGFDGLVIQVAISGVELDGPIVRAGAGESGNGGDRNPDWRPGVLGSRGPRDPPDEWRCRGGA